MPEISSMKSSTFLKKEDVEQPKILTIRKGSFEKRNMAREGDEPDYKWTMGFDEIEQRLVLNVDKLDTMAEIFGSTNTDDFEGRKVVIYVDPTIKFGGKKVGGLRVRAPKQQPASQPQRKSVEDVNAELAGGVGEMDSDVPF